MSKFSQMKLPLKPHPFRLLLALEWILIALAAYKIFVVSGLLLPLLWQGQPFFLDPLSISNMPVLAGLLVLFGLMGLRLPTTYWAKRIYMLVTLVLMVVIAIHSSWGLESISPLLIVILLRSSIILDYRGRWWVAGIMWLVYPITLFPILLVGILFDPIWRSQVQFDPASGIEITPAGGLEINTSFTPEQFQLFLELLQKTIFYFFFDSLFSFGITFIFVLLLVNSLINERQGRRRLTSAHEQLYQYSVQIEDQATLQERNRIARDIHDSLGHLLTTQIVLLQNVELSLRSNFEEAKLFLAQSRQIGADALDELRQSITLLRTDPLQGKTLAEAITQLTENLSRISDVQSTCVFDITPNFPHRIQVAVYRVVEEALTNVHKYSQASQVSIHLGLTSINTNESTLDIALDAGLDILAAHSHCLILKIEDNGIGFHVEQNATGFGLRGMQERAVSLGGQLQIISQPEAGCQVLLTLPLP
jgi:signal transduction histidine kinase